MMGDTVSSKSVNKDENTYTYVVIYNTDRQTNCTAVCCAVR
jgi:hypothetical protein